MKLYKFIPYDKQLVSRAREFRKTQTEAERKFWSEILKNKKLENFKFTRQKPIGAFVVDFYCARLKLAVEIDGDIHKFQQVRDKERDNLLKEKFGLRILRYNNNDVLNDPERVLNDLIRKLVPFNKGDLGG